MQNRTPPRTALKLDASSKTPETPAEAFSLAAAGHGPLQERLDIYSGYSREVGPDINQAYDELIARFSGLKRIGPTVGAPMPDFQLPDQDGRLVSLESLLSEGPLVLSINRGHWCPWCRLELRALAEVHNEVRGLGAQVVSIIPETLAYSGRLKADNVLPFRVLTDLDLAYALSLGLMIWVGDRIRALYQSSGVNLSLFQRNEGWFLPILATFLIGRDGILTARFVDPDFRKRMEPRDILSALRKLSRS